MTVENIKEITVKRYQSDASPYQVKIIDGQLGIISLLNGDSKTLYHSKMELKTYIDFLNEVYNELP
jgi:hypothetical protein